MLNMLLMIAISYLMGSIPTSIIAGKLLKGIDIRKEGSGNAGATNVFRVLGWKAGLVVLLIDMLKGLDSNGLRIAIGNGQRARLARHQLSDYRGNQRHVRAHLDDFRQFQRWQRRGHRRGNDYRIGTGSGAGLHHRFHRYRLADAICVARFDSRIDHVYGGGFCAKICVESAGSDRIAHLQCVHSRADHFYAPRQRAAIAEGRGK